MFKVLGLSCVLICLMLCGCSDESVKEYSKTIYAMDTVMNLRIYSDDEEVLSNAETEIIRIESLLDRGNENSDVYAINKYKSVKVSDETAYVIKRALEMSLRTDGAFDITIAPVMDLWGFYGNEFNVPSDKELQYALESVGYNNVSLNINNVQITDNAAIDLGGIGKGYASDKIAELFKNNGIDSAIISLGGNVHAIGKRPDGELWTVGIADPRDTSKHIGRLKVSDKSVITSGGYQRYFERNGVIYHHIIDPETGKSANNGIVSVTIVADSGIMADVLSTSLFVMGLDKSIEFWRGNHDFESVFVDDTGMIYVTDGLQDYFESDNEYIIIN